MKVGIWPGALTLGPQNQMSPFSYSLLKNELSFDNTSGRRLLFQAAYDVTNDIFGSMYYFILQFLLFYRSADSSKEQRRVELVPK